MMFALNRGAGSHSARMFFAASLSALAGCTSGGLGDSDDVKDANGAPSQGTAGKPATTGGAGSGPAGTGGPPTTGGAGTPGTGAAGKQGGAGMVGTGTAGITGTTGTPDAGLKMDAAVVQTDAAQPTTNLAKFSFFLTSEAAIRRLSKKFNGGDNGFGGDLRYGEKDGLSGADKICTEIAETSMPGSGAKVWRAFLSVTKGPDGTAIDAISRIGSGPWYDRLGRILAENLTNLAMTRPKGAHPDIINDFPNEDGVRNHDPEGKGIVDNHDTLTGTGPTGKLFNKDWKFTCHDWTSAVPGDGTPHVGHSWPAKSGENWMSALNETGCGAGIFTKEMGPPTPGNPTVGGGGGYGGFYCFALQP